MKKLTLEERVTNLENCLTKFETSLTRERERERVRQN